MISSFKLLPVALALACVPALAQVDRVKGGGDDPKSIQSRYTMQSALPEDIAFVPDPAGSERTVMRARISRDNPKVFGGLRAEIVPRDEYTRQGVRWYAISFYVPPDWKQDPGPIVVAQLHTSQHDIVLSPPVSWVIQGDRLQLELRANHRPLRGPDATNKTNSASQTIVLSSLQKSKWYCFVAKADWSSTVGSGSFKLWMNGDKIYDAANLYNTYESALGNYPKTGLYAPGGLTVASEQIYFDSIHLGGPRTGLDEMIALTPCSHRERKSRQ